MQWKNSKRDVEFQIGYVHSSSATMQIIIQSPTAEFDSSTTDSSVFQSQKQAKASSFQLMYQNDNKQWKLQ